MVAVSCESLTGKHSVGSDETLDAPWMIIIKESELANQCQHCTDVDDT